MTTIGERLKILRKELKLTQIDFGGRIAVSQGHLTAMENGKRDVTDKTLKVICMEFHVNEEWLRTGEGEMFSESDGTLFDAFAQENRLTAEEQAAARYLLRLTGTQRRAVLDHVRALAREIDAAEEKAEPPASVSDAPPVSDSSVPDMPPDEEIEAEVSRIRAKMYAKKKTRLILTALPSTENFAENENPPL